MTQTLRLIRILMLFCLDHRWLHDSLGSLQHAFDGSDWVILTDIGHEILDILNLQSVSSCFWLFFLRSSWNDRQNFPIIPKPDFLGIWGDPHEYSPSFRIFPSRFSRETYGVQRKGDTKNVAATFANFESELKSCLELKEHRLFVEKNQWHHGTTLVTAWTSKHRRYLDPKTYLEHLLRRYLNV